MPCSVWTSSLKRLSSFHFAHDAEIHCTGTVLPVAQLRTWRKQRCHRCGACAGAHTRVVKQNIINPTLL